MVSGLPDDEKSYANLFFALGRGRGEGKRGGFEGQKNLR